jgi:hypothetical protein
MKRTGKNQGKYRETRDKHVPWQSVCGGEKNKVKERGKRRTMMTTKTERITYHFELLHSAF